MYQVKCDDCKATIGTTESLKVSAAGGHCDSCKATKTAEIKVIASFFSATETIAKIRRNIDRTDDPRILAIMTDDLDFWTKQLASSVSAAALFGVEL